MAELDVRCIGCKKTPDEIAEYVQMTLPEDEGGEGYESATRAVIENEGTYNRTNGHFACTECYIGMGMPSAPWPGWKAP